MAGHHAIHPRASARGILGGVVKGESKLAPHTTLRLRGVLGSADGALNPALGKGDAAPPLTPSIRFPAPRDGAYNLSKEKASNPDRSYLKKLRAFKEARVI